MYLENGNRKPRILGELHKAIKYLYLLRQTVVLKLYVKIALAEEP